MEKTLLPKVALQDQYRFGNDHALIKIHFLLFSTIKPKAKIK